MLQGELCELPFPNAAETCDLAELAVEKRGFLQKSSSAVPCRLGRWHKTTSKTNNQRFQEVQELACNIIRRRGIPLASSGGGGQVEAVVFCKVPHQTTISGLADSRRDATQGSSAVMVLAQPEAVSAARLIRRHGLNASAMLNHEVASRQAQKCYC